MDWFERHRLLSIGLFLLIIWGIIFVFLYLKADEITKDPCSICAKELGDKIVCTTGGFGPITKTYYENGSINLDFPKRLF